MAFNIEVTAMARALAKHSSVRQSVISENVANADTVGFKARDSYAFKEVYQSSTGGASSAPPLQHAFSAKTTRPGHPGYEQARLAASPIAPTREIAKLGAEVPNGNTVSIEDQLARGAEALLNHQMALGVMRKTGDILRMAIGRAR